VSYRVIYEDVGLRDYKQTWDYQAGIFNKLVDAKKGARNISQTTDTLPGTLILVEHPHVYTLGKNGSENNLLIDYIQLQAKDAAFYKIDRGGDITYHGPGQIVGYPVFDLERMRIGLKEYIFRLEETIIQTMGELGLSGSRLAGSTGVWLEPEIIGKTRKICAIGVKASRYITMHGFAFNVNTDLSYFGHINPCGLVDKGVTSLEKELGTKQDIAKVKEVLRRKIKGIFDLELINQRN
jgi:lipoyl(octanoyl) transferase